MRRFVIVSCRSRPNPVTNGPTEDKKEKFLTILTCFGAGVVFVYLTISTQWSPYRLHSPRNDTLFPDSNDLHFKKLIAPCECQGDTATCWTSRVVCIFID